MGSAKFSFNDQTFTADAGTVILGRPGMTDRYDWDTQQRTLLAFFHFSFDYSEGDWPELKSWPVTRKMASEDVLQTLFRYVIGLARSGKTGQEPILESAVALMLRTFLSGNSEVLLEPQQDLPEAIQKAMKAIRESLAKEPIEVLSLTKLAKAAHVSPEYLCRLFRRHLNMGPLECLALARLERAASLLVRSNLTVKEIADAVGYASPYHFSTKFRKVYGVSPRYYRWSMQSGFMITGNPVIQHLQLHVPVTATQDR